MKPCPECGGTNRKQESGEYALIKLTGGKLELHVDRPKTEAIVVTAITCADCGHVSLAEA